MADLRHQHCNSSLSAWEAPALCITTCSWSQQAHPTLLLGPHHCSKSKKTCVIWTSGNYRHLGHTGCCRCYCPCLSALTPKAGSRCWLIPHQLPSYSHWWRRKSTCRKGMACEVWLQIPLSALLRPRSQPEQQSRTAASCVTPHTAVGSSQAVSELGLKQVSGGFRVRWCSDDWRSFLALQLHAALSHHPAWPGFLACCWIMQQPATAPHLGVPICNPEPIKLPFLHGTLQNVWT